ncbi:type II CAAX endopeptidase family protein [Ruminiclostridium papyrosolvens]|uniref:Peptidase n=1 Tax=Ruminiclostridium papyrosolvens C7 TaxID=1330534 RepID=U4R7C4_9FIRM|nr:type II CAAX endopeptidase family protein [Ruminiclostridium papyrosolvens]EPR14403.1 peptidase [Ruminiclostridium papyrosolvens C7]
MENNLDEQFSSITTDENKKRLPGPVASGILFSIVTILLTFGGPILNFKNSYLKSGLGELIFILLPVMVFLIIGRYDIKSTLNLRGTRPLNYLLVVLLTLFGMPVVGVLNAITYGLIREVFGRNLPVPKVIVNDVPTLFIALLVIGVSAAVCEEVMFRGLIQNGYRKYGIAVSLGITSVLFGLLHRDIQKAVSTILLGALIGFIVYRTGSIFTGMIAHFTNNASAVILAFMASKMTGYLNGEGIQQTQSFDFSYLPTASIAIAFLFYAIIYMGLVSGFVALLYAFYRSTKKDVKAMKEEASQYELTHEKIGLPAILSMLPGLVIILFTFLYQIMKLKWG